MWNIFLYYCAEGFFLSSGSLSCLQQIIIEYLPTMGQHGEKCGKVNDKKNRKESLPSWSLQCYRGDRYYKMILAITLLHRWVSIRKRICFEEGGEPENLRVDDRGGEVLAEGWKINNL